VKPTVEQLENLLALKRHERPDEGYWQDFLCEFHHRQRERAAVQTGFAGLMSRLSAWFTDLSPAKWAYGAGLAYASIAAFMLLSTKPVEKEMAPAAPVNYQVVPGSPSPMTVEQLDELDLSPTTQGSAGEQVF
jgi:hypothetical protein